MSVHTITTQVTTRWLCRKSKPELARIIMANLDAIDLFKEGQPSIHELNEIVSMAIKETDDAWVALLDEIWREHKNGHVFENWALALSARRALQKIRSKP